jgi:hypothetical protein
MEPDKDYIELVEKSIRYRGQILHLTTVLEAIINTYIVRHFCGGEESLEKDMQLLFLGDERVTLSNKSQIFLFLAENYNKTWYDSFVSSRIPPHKAKPYKMSSDLKLIIEERNIFAHRILDHSDNLDYIKPKEEPVVRFVKLKNDIEPLDYTETDFIALSTMIANLTSFIATKLVGI